MAISRGHAVKSAAATWTPASLGSALTSWVQPSGIVGTGSSLVWTDNSPLHLDYVVGQEGGGGGGAPTVGVLTNGLNGVILNGTADAIQSGGSCLRDIFLNGDQFHTFMVAKQLGNGGIGTGVTTQNNPCFWESFNAQWGLYARTVTGTDTTQWMSSTQLASVNGVPGVRAAMCIEAWLTTDGVGHIRVKGAAAVTGAFGPTVPDDGPLSFGYSSLTSAFFNVQIGEFFVSDVALSAPNQALAQAYITSKWGVPA